MIDFAHKWCNLERIIYERLASTNSHQTATTDCLEKDGNEPLIETATKQSPSA
jgi:hypothetical protein